MLRFELHLFSPIDLAYADAQNTAVGIVRDNRPKLFPKIVHLYPVVLFVLLSVVSLVGWLRG